MNIWELRTAKSFVMGMPVDSNWYARRSDIRVNNYEQSTLLSSVYDAAPGAQWFVLDLNDLMASHRKQFSDTISTDIHMRELVYYSLIIRYWPMITNTVFQMFVTNEPDIHNEYPELSNSDSSLRKQLNLETSLISENYMPSISKMPLSVFLNSTNITTASEHFFLWRRREFTQLV